MGIESGGTANFDLFVADVAELADALDSKSSIREDVWVRPPPSAPSKSTTYVDSVDMLLQCCYTLTHEIGFNF